MGQICLSPDFNMDIDIPCKCRHLDDLYGFTINTECNCINKKCRKCGKWIHRKTCLKHNI